MGSFRRTSRNLKRDLKLEDGHSINNRWQGDGYRRKNKNRVDVQSTIVSTPSSVADVPTNLVSSVELPKATTNDVKDGNEQAFRDQTPSSRKSSTPLILGLVCGALVILGGALSLWWLIRRRKRQHILSNSKTILMSSQGTSKRMQYMIDLESQQGYHSRTDLGSEKNPLDSNSHSTNAQPREKAIQSQTVDTNGILNHNLTDNVENSRFSYSSTSLPIQLPTFPPPTPRERRAGISNTSSMTDDSILQRAVDDHRFHSKNISERITLPIKPSAAASTKSTSFLPYYLQHTNPPRKQNVVDKAVGSDMEGVIRLDLSSDFYNDMLDLLLDTGLSPKAAHYLSKQQPSSIISNSPLPCSQLSSRANSRPSSRTNSRPSSHANSRPASRSTSRPPSSGIQTPTRSRSPSRAHGSCTSPRVSKEALRNFPPPPPPPSIPPPAIPVDVTDETIRPPRQRSSTMPAAVGKPAATHHWESSPIILPSELRQDMDAPHVNGECARGKRGGMVLSGACFNNIVIQPPKSPPPAHASLLHLHPKSRELYHRHQRSQSNVLSTQAFATVLNQLSPELPLPKSHISKQVQVSELSRARITSSMSCTNISGTSMFTKTMRPPLSHYHSHHGSSSDSGNESKGLVRAKKTDSTESKERGQKDALFDVPMAPRPKKRYGPSSPLSSSALSLDNQIMETTRALREDTQVLREEVQANKHCPRPHE